MSLKLFTFLGTGNYTECIYQFNGKAARPYKFVQSALAELLLAEPKEDRSINIFVTKDAKNKNWNPAGQSSSGLLAELEDLQKQSPYQDIKIRAIDIPEGFSKDHVWDIFDTLVAHIEEGDQIIFDITHSFRSIPFLSLLLTNYARVFMKIEIKGLVYGALEKLGKPDVVKEMPVEQRLVDLVDLKELIKLLDWSNAADRFLKSGDASQLVELAQTELRPLKMRLKSSDENLNNLDRLINNLRAFSEQVSTCRVKTLITETADHIAENTTITSSDDLPYIKALVPVLRVTKEKLAGLIQTGHTGRAAFLVSWCLEHGQLQQGWTILREIIISYLCEATGYQEHGLNIYGDDRELIGMTAHVIARPKPFDKWRDQLQRNAWLIEKIQGTTVLRKLALLLNKTAQYRNDLDHAEYVRQPHRADKFQRSLAEYFEEFQCLINDGSERSRPPHNPRTTNAEDNKLSREQENAKNRGTQGVLISPLGLSKGLLYSAIRLLKPQHIVVVSSQDAVTAIPEIIQTAAYEGSWQEVLVADPHTCFKEIDSIFPQVLNELPDTECAEIIINITGGTTALQYLVEQVGERLTGLGYRVRNLALLDRRPSEEQKRNPYVVGEVFDLKN